MMDNAGILIVISDLSSGGAQKVASTIANDWATRGKNVTVVTLKPPSEDYFTLAHNVKRIVIGESAESHSLLSALYANLKRLYKIRRAIAASHHPRVISFVTSTNILVILASIGFSKRVIISERNNPAQQSHGILWDGLRRYLYRFASVVTANSREALHILQEYVPDNRLRYVPNPVQIPALTSDSKREASVLHVGKLIEQKAHDIILQAWEKLHPSHPDWYLDFVGEGPLWRKLIQESQSLPCRQTLRWHGWRRDMETLYRRSGIFILPSRFEGTPNALMEAMSFGMPCIISDRTGGALDLIEHEKSGWIISAEDAEALASAITRLMEDESLRNRLGEAAREKIRTHDVATVMRIWDHIAGFNDPDVYESHPAVD